MARSAWLGVTAALFLSACGGGGGGGGGVDKGAQYWGIPFVSIGGGSPMTLGFRNVDNDGTAVTVQGYALDGTPYSGPIVVTIDGYSEERLTIDEALGGDTPAGGWVLVSTPSAMVDVYSSVRIPGKQAEESARGFALPDLLAPPASSATGVNATSETSSIQITNALGTATTITVTPYREPLNPFDPPVAGTPQVLAFAANETQMFAPDDLAGQLGFVGSFFLESANPILAAAVEDLAFDVAHTTTDERQVSAALSFGTDPLPVTSAFYDFVLVLRNDSASSQTVLVTAVVAANGSPVLLAPRAIALAGHESRVIGTLDPPFVDLFGDVTVFGGLGLYRIDLQVPALVDAAFRQFDPQFLEYNMTVAPSALGHVLDVSDVLPMPTTLLGTRTFASILNVRNAEITVTVEAIITQPPGFDAAVQPLTTVTIPAGARVDFSPDGTTFLDRDLNPVATIGLRFRSASSFTVTGWRERRDLSGLLLSLSPLLVRSFDLVN